MMRAVRRPNVLHLEFTDLTRDVAGLVRALESHCGATGIDPAVFDHRINVSAADNLDARERLTSYRKPAELSAAEYEALRSVAAAGCRQFGYPIPAPTELGAAQT